MQEGEHLHMMYSILRDELTAVVQLVLDFHSPIHLRIAMMVHLPTRERLLLQERGVVVHVKPYS